MQLSKNLEQALIEEYQKRFDAAREVEVVSVVVEREGLELTAVVKGKHGEYAVFLTPTSAYCSCMDFRTRKRICKHIIAAALAAAEQGYISEFELATLLVGREIA